MSKVETTLTTFDSWFGSKKALSIIVNMRRGMMFERDIAKAAWEAASSENEALRAQLADHEAAIGQLTTDNESLLKQLAEANEKLAEAVKREAVMREAMKKLVNFIETLEFESDDDVPDDVSEIIQEWPKAINQPDISNLEVCSGEPVAHQAFTEIGWEK